MTNPAHAAAIAFCIEHDLPTTVGDENDERPDDQRPSSDVRSFLAGAKWMSEQYVREGVTQPEYFHAHIWEKK